MVRSVVIKVLALSVLLTRPLELLLFLLDHQSFKLDFKLVQIHVILTGSVALGTRFEYLSGWYKFGHNRFFDLFIELLRAIRSQRAILDPLAVHLQDLAVNACSLQLTYSSVVLHKIE